MDWAAAAKEMHEFLRVHDTAGRWKPVHCGRYYRGKPKLRFVYQRGTAKLRLVSLDSLDEPSKQEKRSFAADESGFRRGYCHGYHAAITDMRELRKQRIQRITEIGNFMAIHLDVLYGWRARQYVNFLPPEMLYPDRYDLICDRVRERDRNRCVECGSRKELEFDHDLEIADGGISADGNMRLLCKPCHHRKSMASAQERGGRRG